MRHSLPALVSKPHCCSPMLIVPWPLFLPCAAIFFLIPNAYVLARKCTWFGSVVLWSGFVRCFGEGGGGVAVWLARVGHGGASLAGYQCIRFGGRAHACRTCYMPTAAPPPHVSSIAPSPSFSLRWTCWNSIFLLFWVQAHNTHPALPRWGERPQPWRKGGTGLQLGCIPNLHERAMPCHVMPCCDAAPPPFRPCCLASRPSSSAPRRPLPARYVNRPDASLMDAPWWVHWPKLSMWCSFEGVLLGLTLYLQTHQMHPGPAPPGGDCTQMVYNCTFRGGWVRARCACMWRWQRGVPGGGGGRRRGLWLAARHGSRRLEPQEGAEQGQRWLQQRSI